MEKTKVAFLMGTDHCGSTLMAFLLDTHPELVSLGESCPPLHFFTPEYLCSCGKSVTDCQFYSRLSLEMQAKGVSFSADNWDNSFMYRSKALSRYLGYYPHNRLKRRLQGIADTHLPIHKSRIERVKRVNVAYYQAALDITGAKVFCDTSKEHNRIQHLRQVDELDSSVIWLVRDVRAFVHSCRKFGLAADFAADQWLKYQEITREIYDSFPEDKRIQLKYEELCQAPEATLGRLHKFLRVEVRPLPEALNQSKHHVLGNKMRNSGKIHVRADEAWRQQLKAEDVDVALQIAGRANEALGYR